MLTYHNVHFINLIIIKKDESKSYSSGRNAAGRHCR